LIQDKKEEVEKVAKMLLEKETITHDDIIDLIGERPFKGDTQYNEYVSQRTEINKNGTISEEDEECTPDGHDSPGGLTPGVGLA
jgi:AFG3 family protein